MRSISDDFEDQFVEILTSVIKSKLTFFEMQVKGAGSHAAEANQACFSITPEAFNPVDVSTALDKFILTVIDSQVFAIADINKTIIAAPTVRVDNALQCYFAANNRL